MTESITIQIEIDFRIYTTHYELISAISPLFSAKEQDTVYITINLVTNSTKLFADFLIILVAAVRYLEDKGINVSGKIQGDKSDPKVQWASRINFFKELGIDFPEKIPRGSSKGKFVEIRTFDEETIKEIQDDLNKILYNTAVSKDVLQLLYYCLNEIMDNVLVHSTLSSGWVSAQYFQAEKEIRLIICDTGIGIHSSLASTPDSKYKDISEQDALEKCIWQNVTNGKGMGFGLYATSQFIKENKGEMLIYSGSHFLTNSGKIFNVHSGEQWQGTIVFLKINTDIPVDYQVVLPINHTLPDDYQNYIDSLFGIDSDLW